MKTMLTSVLLMFCCQVFTQQTNAPTFEPGMKFGKPTEEELTMTTYAPDSSAAAVVLYSKSDAQYDYVNNSFRITYNYEVKIKVLKPEGTSYANISIPFYYNEKNSMTKEVVGRIEATSYNMEDGQVVRTKMKRDLIFEEQINRNYKQIKFSIPAVKAGTVFEYKYQLVSDIYYSINYWEAQKDIPVIYTEYDIVIPEYFHFDLDMRNIQHLKVEEKTKLVTFLVRLSNGQTEKISCNGRRLLIVGRNLNALRADKYIWCANDYRSGVNFEIRGLDFPGSVYKSLTQNWEHIDKILLEDEDFGGMLKMRNPYREEMKALSLDALTDRQSKIEAIYTFLKKKISWNGDYGIFGSEIKKAIKNGTGNNAEINFVLMSMLRDEQIPCYPVVMSRKDMGILPYAHPSLQKLNTFVVAIASTEDSYIFLDGSVSTGFLNVLPPVLMSNRARLVSNKPGNMWIDLSQVGKNQLRSITTAELNANGLVIGKRQTQYNGQYASELRKRFQAAKDSADFIKDIEAKENIQIKDFKTKNMHTFSPQVSETIDFEKQVTSNDNFIYINPMIFLHVSKNPFTQIERDLPLEMPYQETINLVVSLSIPDGYAVEELPENMYIKTEDGQNYCQYNISQQENKINIIYTFACNKLLHLPDEYPIVKSYWGKVVEKNNQMLVLKKL